MAAVGVIGLGHMGRHYATNLIEDGHSVLVYNRSRAPVEEALSQGAIESSHPAEMGSRCQFVVTALPSDRELRQVVLGDKGLLRSKSPELVLVDTSTVAPDTAMELAEAADAAGIAMLDAPVSGGPEGARDRTLAVMVGGDEQAFNRALPIIGPLAGSIELLGPAGAGQTAKAANQVLVAGILQAVSEAIALLDHSGSDTEKVLKVIARGLGANHILTLKGDAIRRRDFRPGGKVSLHHKDLAIALQLAESAGVFLPLGAMVQQFFGALVHTGRGDMDHSALLSLIDEFSAPS